MTMGHPKFSQEDFLAAALAIMAERGVSGVTVASVSERLGSPTGSFYHRFASRDVLLGSLWLRAVLDFQTGIAPRSTPATGWGPRFIRPPGSAIISDERACSCFHDRRDFLEGEWPPQLRERVAEMTRRMEAGSTQMGAGDLRQGRAATRCVWRNS